MTVIIMARKGNKVVIGADSLTTYESTKLVNVTNDSKIITFQHFKVAIAGDGPISDVLQYIKDFEYEEDEYDWGYHKINTKADCINFVTNFIEKFTERAPETGSEDLKYEFLITNGESIWWAINGPSVFEIGTFWSAGSGSSFAIGNLDSTYDKTKNLCKAVEKAIKCACRYTVNCEEPYEIEEYTKNY